LDEDVSEALPYLNASLGGFTYIKDPPSVTLRVHGKLITVYGDRIAVNALKDEEEADKILRWLQGEINETWEKRDQIRPSYESAPLGGSLFTIFPLLKVLREKGARVGALASFITAWGGKAPLLPLETQFLGWPFAILRLSLVVVFALLMGILMDWVGEKSAGANVDEIEGSGEKMMGR
jgi:hypothetical protein